MPEREVVSNTSPLLYLHQVGQLDLLLLPMVTDLGRGEAEALALALAFPGSLLILDDALGRRIAQHLELTYTGTLGVLVKAKKEGHLPAVKPVLEALIGQTTMYLSGNLVGWVLREAGEG